MDETDTGVKVGQETTSVVTEETPPFVVDGFTPYGEQRENVPVQTESDVPQFKTVNQLEDPDRFSFTEIIRDSRAHSEIPVDKLFGGSSIQEEDGSWSYDLNPNELREVNANLEIKRMADRLEKTADNSTLTVGEKYGRRAEGKFSADIYIPKEGRPLPREVKIDPDLMKTGDKIYIIVPKWIPGRSAAGGHPDTNPQRARESMEHGGYVKVIGELERFSDGSVGYERLTPEKSEELLTNVVNAVKSGKELPPIHTLGVKKDAEGTPQSFFIKPDALSMGTIAGDLKKSESLDNQQKVFIDYVKSV